MAVLLYFFNITLQSFSIFYLLFVIPKNMILIKLSGMALPFPPVSILYTISALFWLLLVSNFVTITDQMPLKLKDVIFTISICLPSSVYLPDLSIVFHLMLWLGLLCASVFLHTALKWFTFHILHMPSLHWPLSGQMCWTTISVSTLLYLL